MLPWAKRLDYLKFSSVREESAPIRNGCVVLQVAHYTYSLAKPTSEGRKKFSQKEKKTHSHCVPNNPPEVLRAG